jgi:hypothetical protein
LPHGDGEVGACLFACDGTKPADGGVMIYLKLQRPARRGRRCGGYEPREGAGAEAFDQPFRFSRYCDGQRR